MIPAFLPIRRFWSNTFFSRVLSHSGGERSIFLPTGTAGLFCGLRGCLLFQPSPGGRCPSAHTGADEGNGLGNRRTSWNAVGEGLAPPEFPCCWMMVRCGGVFRLRARYFRGRPKVPKGRLRNPWFLRTSFGGDLIPAFLPIRRSWSNTCFSRVLSHLGGGRFILLPTNTAGPGW